MITIKEIAKLTGVSYSTVSKALNDSPLVKSSTKQKILSVATQHNYRKNIPASQLVSGKSRLIGLAVRDMGNPVFSQMVLRLHNLLLEHNYQMILTVATNGIELLNQLGVDGILFWGHMIRAKDELRQQLLGSSAPALLLGAEIGGGVPSILVDRKAGILEAVRYLHSRGHRRIGLIGDSQQEKLDGYYEALRMYGLESSPEYVLQATKTWEDGYAAASLFQPGEHSPTAFIGINNMVTQGALRGFRERGLHIPNQLSLIAYDDVQELQYADVPITAVGPRLNEMERLAVETMMALLKNKPVEEIITVHPMLHERKSVADFVGK